MNHYPLIDIALPRFCAKSTLIRALSPTSIEESDCASLSSFPLFFSRIFLTTCQARHGDDRLEQGRVFHEEPLGADGVQALSHIASH